LADIISYLPLDTSENAKRWVEMIRPELVIFVKYDYWYHHLHAVAAQNIPLILVSAIFRENAVFFKWYGSFHRHMLHFFTRLFVQDEVSEKRLKDCGIMGVTTSGDTRFDRVSSLAEKDYQLPLIAAFAEREPVVVAGSTWPDDEVLLQRNYNRNGYKLILAPHEVTHEHISKLKELFPQSLLYTNATTGNIRNADVLIIDNVGMLSRLYKFATVAYIGGGFNRSGIHNTLEAAVWGKPVLFGPHYKKFREARDLVRLRGAFPIHDDESLEQCIHALLKNETNLKQSGDAARNYVIGNQGATETIMRFIHENRLLTS
jgi:3-deoxy-D-manno-octulosonic-acid transferase